jgi:hypothetical protein
MHGMKENNKTNPILIVGVPRGGTTWAANILAQTPGTVYIHEPGNERTSFLGYLNKMQSHRMPYLNQSHSDPKYYQLFDQAFNKLFPSANTQINKIAFKFSGLNPRKVEKLIQKKIENIRRLGEVGQLNTHKVSYTIFKNLLYPDVKVFDNKRRIIKSVHSGLAIEFLKNYFDFRLVIVFRHPANVIASYLQLKSEDGSRDIFEQPDLKNDFLQPYLDRIKELESPLSLMGFQIAIFYYYWENTVLKNGDTLVLQHEDLCVQTEEKFRRIFKSLDLEWNDKVVSYIQRNNKEGEGYQINRIAKNELDKWKKKLTPAQIKEIQKGYRILPVRHYCEFIEN